MNKNCKMTIGAMLLLTTAFSAFSANAQTCAVPPTCESLGYDKSADECVDKAVLKCPFDENKIFVPTELPMELQLKITAAVRDLTALTRLVTN